MVPAFDLQGGWPLTVARGVSVGGLLSVFGALTFRVLVVPKAFARASDDEAARLKRQLLWVSQLSTLVCLLGLAAWIVVESATMADADSLAAAFAAVPLVLRKTFFGHISMVQVVVLAAIPPMLGLGDTAWRQRAGLALATLALCLHAGHSHAASMYDGPSFLLACDIVHLLAAGAWLGALLPLMLVVRGAVPCVGAMAARWFSPLGRWCVGLLAGTALVQGYVLVASFDGLLGTAYGWMVLAKLALNVVLVGFACANRYRFAPALLRAEPEAARRVLLRSIALQTGFSVAIVVAAVVLSELPPSMHMDQM
jgi:putative copper resistance protein D